MPSCSLALATISALLSRVEARRLALASADRQHKATLGQFLTPAATARLMAGMSQVHRDHIRVLDAGAGVGSLTAAWVAGLAQRTQLPKRVTLTAYEIDAAAQDLLRDTLTDCAAACAELGVACDWNLRGDDFVEAMVTALDRNLFQTGRPAFDIAILNPPYKKFRSESRVRAALRCLGIETGNLYTAFLALVVEALAPEGEVVAITPRSFCNGPYFRRFREYLLGRVSLTRIHTFESRDRAFRDDDVLQENLILRAVRTRSQQPTVRLTESRGPEEPLGRAADVAFEKVVRPMDRERFIHLILDERGHELAAKMLSLPCTLDDLGLAVSTGRVVDFRAAEWLRHEPDPSTAPLIYPTHFASGRIAWPKPGLKKPNAIVRCAESEDLMVPSGVYVLVKRFSSKEEPRRIVAAAFDGETVRCEVVGFENHLNYYHARGRPLDASLAWGLTLFLNSTPVDALFRQFNGHTQVNATDLRSLRYPSISLLRGLGAGSLGALPDQAAIDGLVGLLL
jgi:adenine-specific DNA-methyltransferase